MREVQIIHIVHVTGAFSISNIWLRLDLNETWSSELENAVLCSIDSQSVLNVRREAIYETEI
jgi:hypothetical protein